MTWKPVFDPWTHRYVAGFNREALYQFRREGGAIQSFRLCDQSPYFNIAGLMWRDPLDRLRA